MPIDKNKVRRLLVRGPNWVGDAVMCEPALRAVRGLFPSAEITLLAKPHIGELLKGGPAIDRILPYEDPGQHTGLVGKWMLARRLHRENFHLAILFQNAFEAALLAFLAGIPRRYGYATDSRGFLLTQAVPVPARSRITHQVDYYLDMLRPLGASPVPHSPSLYLLDEEERTAERRLAEAGVRPGDFLIGVNPGSVYGGAKRWLPERFAQTADRLIEIYRARSGTTGHVVIVGARGEEGIARTVAAQMRHQPLELTGKTTIRELMAVVKSCSIFLTNDTGPMHIAAAFQVPLVAVFGPTDVRTTAPHGTGHALVRHAVECAPCLLRECPIDHRCMTGVTVDMVVESALAQLQIPTSESVHIEEVEGRPESSNMTPPQSAHLRTPLQGLTVFLDRDGTLNRDTGYIKTPEEIELFPGVVNAIGRLKGAGAHVIIVTNQSGVARGMITPAGLEAVHAKIRSLLAEGGASLDAIYFCPHHPDENCGCRKPNIAMIQRAAVQLGLDPNGYYVVGDQRRDVELGERVGARTILVTTGPASQEHLAALQDERRPPNHVAGSLADAVEWIFEDAGRRKPGTDGMRRESVRPLQPSRLDQ